MHAKKEDIAGLQLADLIAYPLTRYVLDKRAVNSAFDVIRDKIYSDDKGKLHGLKEFP